MITPSPQNENFIPNSLPHPLKKKSRFSDKYLIFSFNVLESIIICTKMKKMITKKHSWGMMDQNVLSKWSKRSLSIIFIMINYNPDQKNAPFFRSRSEKCFFFSRSKNFCFYLDQNKWFFFIDRLLIRIKNCSFSFIWINKMLPFFWSGLKILIFFSSGWKKWSSFYYLLLLIQIKNILLCLIRIKKLPLVFGCRSKIYVHFLIWMIFFLSR